MARKYNLYGQENGRKGETEYEVVTLPLQNYVSSVRKFVSHAWKSVKVQKNKAKDSVGNSLEAADSKVKGAMQSVGVRNTRAALEVTAAGIGATTGLLLAWRKSAAHRIAYPLLIGGAMWGALYCSSAQNRTRIHSQIKSIQSGYMKSTKSNK